MWDRCISSATPCKRLTLFTVNDHSLGRRVRVKGGLPVSCKLYTEESVSHEICLRDTAYVFDIDHPTLLVRKC